jgi:hypothetical protein
MDGLQQKHGLKGLILGREPTGHYGINPANWLANKGKHVVMVKPPPNETRRTEIILPETNRIIKNAPWAVVVFSIGIIPGGG